MRTLGGVIILIGVLGLLWALFRNRGVPCDLQPKPCPFCGELTLGGDLCATCSAHLKALPYCEKHDIVYEGEVCPKCKHRID